MNELAMIFERLGIDTLEVLQAAGTKWNFMPFRPGWWPALHRGRSVLSHRKAEFLGYHPESSSPGDASTTAWQICGRAHRQNDDCGRKAGAGARIAILGITFKEDVPDLRNTKVVDIVRELKEFGTEVVVSDAMADPDEARAYYGIELVPLEAVSGWMRSSWRCSITPICSWGFPDSPGFATPQPALVFDVKGCFRPEEAMGMGVTLPKALVFDDDFLARLKLGLGIQLVERQQPVHGMLCRLAIEWTVSPLRTA